MPRTCILVCAAVALAILCAHVAPAAVITFETRPDGTPTLPADDDQAIPGPYPITGGGTVQFFFDKDGDNELTAGDDPGIFEHINQDGNDGFVNNIGVPTVDVAAPGFAGQLGQWFLRGVTPGAIPPPFIIDYNTAQTITELSGEIWDIDGNGSGTEKWFVEVLDGSNNVLTSLSSLEATDNTTDSMPWTFAFTGLPLGVDKVRVTFTGTKTFGVGLAFNNFSPTVAVPEPSSIALFVVGAAPLAMLVRRRRAKGVKTRSTGGSKLMV